MRGRSETYVDRVSSIVCLDSDLEKKILGGNLNHLMRFGIFSQMGATIAEINEILL